MVPKPILFLDRDGTILVEPIDDFRLIRDDQFQFLPNVIDALSSIASLQQYHFVLVTNQDGLGTKMYPMEIFEKYQQKMIQTLASNGIVFLGIHIDVTFEEDNKNTRKPGIGMLTEYIENQDMFDIKTSIVIGDSKTDIQLAKNLGCCSILLENKHNLESYNTFTDDETKAIVFRSDSWINIRDYVVDLLYV